MATSSSVDNPVTAVDDRYVIAKGETKYFNTRYLTWNDKGADGGLKVTTISATSRFTNAPIDRFMISVNTV